MRCTQKACGGGAPAGLPAHLHCKRTRHSPSAYFARARGTADAALWAASRISGGVSRSIAPCYGCNISQNSSGILPASLLLAQLRVVDRRDFLERACGFRHVRLVWRRLQDAAAWTRQAGCRTQAAGHANPAHAGVQQRFCGLRGYVAVPLLPAGLLRGVRVEASCCYRTF